ncbi:MAG: sugar phosphate isomerase/epimerase, partial [Caldilineaceae bacterium]|nr:sugar phosphate isomerase/epimerase [Caldilineaceae bacterium]
MQLGFVSAILPDLSGDEVIDFAGTEGFDCVEIMCWPEGKAERRYAGVTHINVADLSDRDVGAI